MVAVYQGSDSTEALVQTDSRVIKQKDEVNVMCSRWIFLNVWWDWKCIGQYIPPLPINICSNNPASAYLPIENKQTQQWTLVSRVTYVKLKLNLILSNSARLRVILRRYEWQTSRNCRNLCIHLFIDFLKYTTKSQACNTCVLQPFLRLQYVRV